MKLRPGIDLSDVDDLLALIATLASNGSRWLGRMADDVRRNGDETSKLEFLAICASRPKNCYDPVREKNNELIRKAIEKITVAPQECVNGDRSVIYEARPRSRGRKTPTALVDRLRSKKLPTQVGKPPVG